MGFKRSALHTLLDPPTKRPRPSGELAPAIGIPQARHHPHPDCRSGTNFHSVPYPLNLLPYQSWCALHFRKPGPSGALEIQCPVCATPQPASAHHQKLFLVAERLLFDLERTPTAVRQKNEEANWGVNFQLGILDPFVEDLQGHISGGKHSRAKRCYPFENELEMGAVMSLIEKGGVLTQSNWIVWKGMIDQLPLDGTDDLKPDEQNQPQASQWRKTETPTMATDSEILTTGPTENLSWVSELEEEDIAESHDHLLYLKQILQEKDHALAMHQAAGTTPPLSLTQSHRLIKDDIKETEDIIRAREELESRKDSGVDPRNRRALGNVNINSLLAPTLGSNSNPTKPTIPTFPPTPISSPLLDKGLSTPPSSLSYHPLDLRSQATLTSTPPNRLPTISTLPSLYSSLDHLERASPTGARFLEAYAEFLRWDMCSCCWFLEMIDMPGKEGGGGLLNAGFGGGGVPLGKRPEWRAWNSVRRTGR
ncbi:MAG: hypothetical protein M1839_000561 [Geoglossum umbratile]|nr:MAG: hypothetical protein M1839_000561 [Geoglossum umbratile]